MGRNMRRIIDRATNAFTVKEIENEEARNKSGEIKKWLKHIQKAVQLAI